MTSVLSFTSRIWLASMCSFMSVPAFVSASDPPSYLMLYPLYPVKSALGVKMQRTVASVRFISIQSLRLPQLLQPELSKPQLRAT